MPELKQLFGPNSTAARCGGVCRQRRAVQPLPEPLSARELQVLEQIANDLNIAEGTVKNHMSQVLAKLGALDRTQAALRARELGLL